MKKPSRSSEVSPKVLFATQYLNSSSTLNALAAKARCQSLLDDIEQAKQWMASYEQTQQWLPWFGLEVFSYYRVAFVTCLEWHARSRLVDMLRFKPSAIGADDIKGAINDKLLSEMVATGADIPGLVGASRLISNADSYFSVFKRVFSELSIPKNADEISAELQSQSDQHPRTALQHLFDDRHLLVHEITPGEIGPWIARTNLNLNEAEAVGTLVLSTISIIEREISTHAPEGFPNKLTLDGVPFDEIAYLDREIGRLETLIANALNDDPEDSQVSRAEWMREINAYDMSKTASIEFIGACDIAGQRYFDYKNEMCIGLRKDRLQHLRRIEENIVVEVPVPSDAR